MHKPKLLGEFLQEQQEPFSLKTYLLERGYHEDTNRNAATICNNSAKILKHSAIFGIKKRSDSLPNCSNLLKLAFSQIVSVNNIKRIKNSRDGGQDSIFSDKQEKRGEEHAQDKSSFAFSTVSMSNTCTESDVEDTESDAEDSGCRETYNECSFVKICDFLSEKHGNADRKMKRRGVDDNKQLSPISVLEETELDDGSPIHHTQCYSNPTQRESSSTSTSHSKLKHSKKFQEMHDHNISDSYCRYIINKRLLSESKKLLVDCTREIIKNQREKNKKREQLNIILGTDELWKLVCEDVWLWSQDSIDETNTVLLLHSDYWTCAQEWSDFPKQQKSEISMEIGDAILDDIISDTFTRIWCKTSTVLIEG